MQPMTPYFSFNWEKSEASSPIAANGAPGFSNPRLGFAFGLEARPTGVVDGENSP